MSDDERSRIARLRSRSPGADPEDPYEDVDVSTLPEWWQWSIRKFEAHDLRPYRPPRFADESLTHEVVDELEREHGIQISFGSRDVDYQERWEVRVDGGVVGKIGRHRSPDGFTVYEIDGDEFGALIRDALDRPSP